MFDIQGGMRVAKDLTNSQVDRQNILNNDFAIAEIQKTSKIDCILFEDKFYLTKNMVASFYDVDIRTIERYVSDNAKELLSNGYEIIKGKRLKEFINSIIDVPDINVGNISAKTPQLAIFDFKSFLNFSRLINISCGLSFSA